MRITKIHLQNFRQYRNCVYTFEKRANDIHIIVGENFQGKSNLLNSINWCLYNEEPHLTDKNKALAIPNTNALIEPSQDPVVPVMVELDLEDEGKKIKFVRKAQYSKQPDLNSKYRELFNKLIIQKNIGRGNNWDIIDDDELLRFEIDKYFPKNIREVFFFDGEQLSSYFKSSSTQRIKNNITLISQIQILEIIEDRLDKIITKKNSEAIGGSKDLSLLEKEILALKNSNSEISDCLESLKSELLEAKSEKERLDEVIGSIDDLTQINDQRKLLQKQIIDTQVTILEKESSLIQAAPGYIMLSYCHQDLLEFQNLISEMQKKKQIPPRIDKKLLEQSIKDDKCVVCNTKLTKAGRENIENTMESISISSEFARHLNEQASQISINLNNLLHTKELITIFMRDIHHYKEIENRLKQRLDDLDRKISSIPDLVDMTNKWNKRKEIENAIEMTTQEIGAKKAEYKRNDENITMKQGILDKELKKRGIVESLKKEIDFCRELQRVVTEAKIQLIDETREDARKITKQTFFSLHWAKESYKDVLLSENYELDVRHKSGSSCIGSLSGAERALLALSYIMAMHKISNLNLPLIIDTPIATISGTNRENFSKVLAEIGKTKELILLFTPAEYSLELQSVFNEEHATLRRLICSNGESHLEEY